MGSTTASPTFLPDIYLVGTGQRFPDHLTIEATEALTDCARVFTLLRPDEISSLPPDIATKTESVWPLYLPDRVRAANYEAAIEAVIGAALLGGSVCWLSLGNPRVLDSVSTGLIKRGAESGLAVEALPAVSSIDSVLIDVGYDPADGVMVLECTTTVVRCIPLTPTIATLLMQPGTFGTRHPRMNEDSPPIDLVPLREHILQYLPAAHPVAFVISSPHRHARPDVVWVTVESLGEVRSEVVRSSTLYIPPAESKAVNLTFLDALNSSP